MSTKRVNMSIVHLIFMIISFCWIINPKHNNIFLQLSRVIFIMVLNSMKNTSSIYENICRVIFMMILINLYGTTPQKGNLKNAPLRMLQESIQHLLMKTDCFPVHRQRHCPSMIMLPSQRNLELLELTRKHGCL